MRHIVGIMAECGQESQGVKEYGDRREAKESICGCFLRRESEELQGYGVRAKEGWESQEMLTE